MKIVRARHLGMCFGVRDAIQLARDNAAAQPLTVLGDLVHNPAVAADLAARGVVVRRAPDELETRRVMITAHGTSRAMVEVLSRRGHEVVEATCPLVHFAHAQLDRLVEAGFHPVIVGLRNHPEVLGMTGDHPDADVILSEEDVANITAHGRFGVVAQTTQPLDRVRDLVACLRRRFPAAEVRMVDTVCQPTKQRQAAAEELAMGSDVVVVIGGRSSNNTRELMAMCSRFCRRVHHVEAPADLRPEWFEAEDTVGVTAGTSTPETVIEGVVRWLERRGESLAGPGGDGGSRGGVEDSGGQFAVALSGEEEL